MRLAMPGPETLATLVSGVTQTMFGLSFQLAPEMANLSPWVGTPPWRTVLLPIPGRVPVTIAIAADEHGGKVLGGCMFACDHDGVDVSMVDDSLCELANIVAGQVKSVMGLDQALGLPKLVDHGATGARLSEQKWQTATLASGSTRVVVWVAVTESDV